MIKKLLQLIAVWLLTNINTVLARQNLTLEELEETVYQLNNKLKYSESQALLLPLLQDKTLSSGYRFKVAILLSYTYKRVFDYQSALKFLDVAKEFAQNSADRKYLLANILSEQAFVYFDVHRYAKSDSIMRILAKSDFKYIASENKSKLLMQQGYLLFLDKQNEKADVLYNQALELMQRSNPCNLPMIYVKKIQLYNGMGRKDLFDEAVRKSELYADSCGIIKYHLYTNEELLKIYEAKNDVSNIVKTKKKLDSLNEIYSIEQNISNLHNQKEKILLQVKDDEINRVQTSEKYLALILAGSSVLIIYLISSLILFTRKQRCMEAEFSRIKSEPEQYLISGAAQHSGKDEIDQTELRILSERQKEVLHCLAKGMSNKEVADKLCISENTVKYHIKNIYQLLDIKGRKGLFTHLKIENSRNS